MADDLCQKNYETKNKTAQTDENPLTALRPMQSFTQSGNQSHVQKAK